MREINPRAWSIDGECWCSRVDYDGYKKQWTGIVEMTAPDIPGKYIGEYTTEPEDIILEFPTGLKDKNGKEIYGGDIIDFFGEKYPVIYRAGCFWAEYSRTQKDYLFLYAIDSEVIGNIHDNPELLEGKEG